MSPSGRNPIERRRARKPPSRRDEAAMNPHAKASITGTSLASSLQAGYRGPAAPVTYEQTGQGVHHDHDGIVKSSAPPSEPYSLKCLVEEFCELRLETEFSEVRRVSERWALRPRD